MMKSFLKTLAALTAYSLIHFTASATPAVVLNSENTESIDSDKLTALLIGKRKFWDGGGEVVIAMLKDDDEVSSALEQYTRMNDSRFKSHWQRLAFSGRGTMPKQFSDPEALIAFVKGNKGAIGIVTESSDISSLRKYE